VACWITLENFDFGPNICHKGKNDGVENRGGRKRSAIKEAEKMVSAVESGKGKGEWQLW